MLDICSTSIILTRFQNFKRLNACLINIHIPPASPRHHIAARLTADENGTLGPDSKTFRDYGPGDYCVFVLVGELHTFSF